VLLGEGEHPLVAERVGRRRLALTDDAGLGLDGCGGVRVAVGIDADHVVGFVCEHSSGPPGVGLAVGCRARREIRSARL